MSHAALMSKLVSLAQSAAAAQEETAALVSHARALLDQDAEEDKNKDDTTPVRACGRNVWRERVAAWGDEATKSAETAAVALDTALERLEESGESGESGECENATNGSMGDLGLTARRCLRAFTADAGLRTLFLVHAYTSSPRVVHAALQTLVRRAVYSYNVDTIALLLQDGRADPTGLLNLACIINDSACTSEVVELLLQDGRECKHQALLNMDLLTACRYANLSAVEVLLRDGRADPTACLDGPSACLRVACTIRSTRASDVVKLLLKDGRADPAASDSLSAYACVRMACMACGMSSLHSGRLTCFKIVAQLVADTRVRTSEGRDLCAQWLAKSGFNLDDVAACFAECC
jgi:hypothetical protein